MADNKPEMVDIEKKADERRDPKLDDATNLHEETRGEIRYASFDRRLISFTVDIAISFILITIAQNIYNIFYGNNLNEKMQHFFVEYGGQKGGMSLDTVWNYMIEQGILYDYIAWNFVIQFSIMTTYVMISWIKFNGVTPGKWLTRTKIVDAQTFQTATIHQDIIRFLAYPLLLLTLGVGMAIISFRKDRRGLHDLISGTAVIVKPSTRKRYSNSI